MKTYLFAWNPNRWNWADIGKVAQRTRKGKRVLERWSCGKNRHIQAGDRAFLIHLGQEPRGLVGSGIVISDVLEGKHGDKKKSQQGQTALYADIKWDPILNPEKDKVFTRESLKEETLSQVHWETQISVINIPEPVTAVLEDRQNNCDIAYIPLHRVDTRHCSLILNVM